MTDFIIKIYDYMRAHKIVCALSFVVLLVLLVLQVLRLNYSEDISDFLPLDNKYQKALRVYQDISGANKLFVTFQYKDSAQTEPDVIVEAIDMFAEVVAETDKTGMVKDLTTEVDLDKMSDIGSFVYENIPYFLEDKDYERVCKSLSDSTFVKQQLSQDKQLLMFPTGGLLSANIQRDPLNLFTPVVEKLQRSTTNINYELYNGYIFTPDMQRGIVMMDSPFGSSETENNAKLLTLLDGCANKVTAKYSMLALHVIGGPAIAVGNSTQIKKDSILSVSIAVVLILLLLFMAFRSVKNLLLIVVSIGWGWLFAVSGLALVHNSVSVIVIGISSVILGIAVNYPLHLIAHLSHTPSIRSALKEIVTPLVVGNITTVGAFLCLVPLQSVALRDLGLFSSLLLIGTILFVVLYLPHVAKARKLEHESSPLLSRLGDVSLDNKPWIWISVLVLTAFFGYYSFQAKYDSNISHINYMTDEQKLDMSYLQGAMVGRSDGQTLYVVSADSSLDAALDNSLQIKPRLEQMKQSGDLNSISSCNRFVVSKNEQQRRLGMWKAFVEKYSRSITESLQYNATKEGFSADSFDEFLSIMNDDYGVQDVSYFEPLMNTVFATNITKDEKNGVYSVIDILNVDDKKVAAVEQAISVNQTDSYCFDIQSMNSAIANNLSNDFNYIGWACGFIVFFFLWFSFGSIELALLSFLPMAVSWIWILGIMGLLDIQFNIVNVILATFIFGQGDDYTIFMTEGAMYEYTYRKKMLASYKNSIIISALIMFIGIGTLIFAKHPALHSLAEVTIVGMFTVVLMAYLFPPLIYKWLVMYKNGSVRVRPISLKSLSSYLAYKMLLWASLIFVYVRGLMLFSSNRLDAENYGKFRSLVQRASMFVVSHIPTVRFVKSEITMPVKYECGNKSMLAIVSALAIDDKVMLAFDSGFKNKGKVISSIANWLILSQQSAGDNASASSLTVSGTDEVLIEDCLSVYPGEITVNVGQGNDCDGMLQDANLRYYAAYVADRYRYKGKQVDSVVRKDMRKALRDDAWIKSLNDYDNVLVLNNDYGDMALLLALVYPTKQILALIDDEDNALLAKYSTQDVVANITYISAVEQMGERQNVCAVSTHIDATAVVKDSKCDLLIVK